MLPVPQAAKRGRPRPTVTIDRDEQIHALLVERPRTRGQLAAELGLSGSLVHLSLKRLQAEEPPRVRQCAHKGVIVWSVADGTPCP